METDPATVDNQATVTTTVERRADLSLAKAASSDPVVAGAILTYTLTVVNAGPDAASGVTVTDTLSPIVAFRSASPGCASNGNTVICALGTLSAAPGSNTRPITIAVTVPATATHGASLPNSAIVSALETDPFAGDNSSSIDTAIIRQADLAVTKAAPPGPVVAGSEATFTVTVTNLGQSLATGVTITDTLPAGTTFVAASGSPVQSGSQVTWTLAELAPQAPAAYTVRVAVDALASGSITNTAGATAAEADPVPGNNVGSASVNVVGVADLSVTKIALPDTVIQDQSMTYVVTVTNLGPGLATGVRLTDTLPADLQNPTYTWSQGACSGTSAVACQVGSLAGDAAATLTITGTVKHGTQTLRNVARVTADQVDGVTGNNTYTLTTNAKQADLSVTKSASPSPAVAGNELTYTIVITNGGPDDATGVVMQDAVSVDLTFLSASAGCSFSAGTVTCSVGSIAKQTNSNTRTLTATFGIPAGLADGTVLQDTASVDGVETDVDPGNNSFTLDTTANRRADLGVTKAASAGQVATGGSVTYTIAVTNNGPSEASSVALTDTLPLSTTFAGASGSPQVSGRAVTWTLGTLAPGQAVTRSLAITVDEAARGTITNTAGAFAAEPDPSAPNVALAAVNVAAAAPLTVTVSGPVTGTEGAADVFTATVDMAASLPITYLWEISPTLAITHADVYGRLDTVALTWSISGTRVITVTASNSEGSALGTHATDLGLTGPAPASDVRLAGAATRNGDPAIEAVQDAIIGLTAGNDSPTVLGSATNFTASVVSGTDVIYRLGLWRRRARRRHACIAHLWLGRLIHRDSHRDQPDEPGGCQHAGDR